MTYTTPSDYYSGYAFDLDGTIYLGDSLLPDAAEVLRELRQRGARVVFVSNNPTHSRKEIRAKLIGLGIPAPPETIVNSSKVLVTYLQDRASGCTVYPISERPLREELVEAGFGISEDPRSIEFVVASFDRTFDYHKLQVAFDAIRAGATLIATNADPYCPVPGGGEPDAAAVIAAVEACTGTTLEAVLGKPSLVMAQTILDELKLPPGECLLVGDRLGTDMLMGKRAGMGTALVLTGATNPAQLDTAEIVPDFVLKRLGELLPEGL
jgi:NagD protein